MKQLSKNLKVLEASVASTDEEGYASTIKFTCEFFGEDFYAWVSKRNVEKDWPSIEAEGATELFDSFESQMTEEYWEDVKAIFRTIEKEHNAEFL